MTSYSEPQTRKNTPVHADCATYHHHHPRSMIMSRGCCSVVMIRMHGWQHGAVHVGIVRHLYYRDNQKDMWKNETNKGEKLYEALF